MYVYREGFRSRSRASPSREGGWSAAPVNKTTWFEYIYLAKLYYYIYYIQGYIYSKGLRHRRSASQSRAVGWSAKPVYEKSSYICIYHIHTHTHILCIYGYIYKCIAESFGLGGARVNLVKEVGAQGLYVKKGKGSYIWLFISLSLYYNIYTYIHIIYVYIAESLSFGGARVNLVKQIRAQRLYMKRVYIYVYIIYTHTHICYVYMAIYIYV